MLESFIIPLAGFATYYFYYKVFVCQRAEVYIHPSNDKLKSLLQDVKSLKEKYNPPLLFFEGRLQTILGISQRVMKNLPYEREILKLKDGGIVGLDFLGDKDNKDRPLLLFLPGLTSSSQTTYVKTLVASFFKTCDVIVFNNRGNGGVPFKTPRSYSASNTEDLIEVISHIKSKYEGRTLVAVGTSLGGILLSKYLTTENEKDIPFKYAMLISIIWDCEKGSINLEKPFINLYVINRELTKGLIKLAERAANSLDNLPPHFNMEEIRKCKTIRDFDKKVTAPQFGFKSDLDYYDFNSTKDITKFPIPVIGISAADDPIQPGEYLPIKDILDKPSNLALIKTNYGGHLGFLEGMGKSPAHYLEKICGEIMSRIVKDL